MAIDSVEPETDVNPNAIVFISPGSEPDVRFRVFDDEYHLHSTVLKYHSRFFRQFLDSPDKPAGPASKSFCYEYVSFFDKDGSDWSLQPASKALQRLDAPAGFDFVTESKAFGKYLCALYTRPYVIDHPQELIVMMRMADYYCTLPILSATLFVLNSEQELFSDFVGSLIFAARDLHHAELFREWFVRIVSLWTSEEPIRGQDFLGEDPQLFTLIQKHALRRVRRFSTFSGT
ncbi:hypothetical protein BKA61DRAFT_5312 [Leptodontidium sp. MPI-SDFR-AT-0119]|nr:hypothetical protein BKA61DRAFT_5312 [Leptodontidium sp. MPI-SDFR-AT-0119]